MGGRVSELETLNENVKYIRDKLDAVDSKVDGYQLSNEHRISKLEERAGLFGAIGGVVGAVGAYLGFHVGK
jgi:hypothetical protein